MADNPFTEHCVGTIETKPGFGFDNGLHDKSQHKKRLTCQNK